jgi:beta-N-acetylhexosaminidase
MINGKFESDDWSMKRMLRPVGLLALLILVVFLGLAFKQHGPKPLESSAVSEERATFWVDSVYNQMTQSEQIGQLLNIRAHSDKGADHVAAVERLIREYHVGGLTFFQGSPEEQARLTNKFQALTRHVPLMIAMDAEWGLGMRLKEDAISFPYQLMLGAITRDELLYEMGAEVARQCRRLGVHVNFAPVVDVNNNPQNPVINYRSFGENRYNVTTKSYLYMKGMQDHGLLACAKHFPGHGDTDTDSHLDLPVINHSLDRLDSIELFPFQVMAEQGIGSMMVAHLQVPALDSTANLPTTLSFPTVTGLLREKMGYDGLVFTDGLGMRGVTKHFEPGELEVLALEAGNDILLLPEDVPATVKAIEEALQSGRLTSRRLAQSVKKVLRAKFDLGLTGPQQVQLEGLTFEMKHPRALALKKELIREALTLVANEGQLLPLRRPDTMQIASLSMGASSFTPFQEQLSRYADIRHFQTGKNLSGEDRQRWLRKLADYDLVIVGLHDMSQHARYQFGLTGSQKTFLQELAEQTQVLPVFFGNPYALEDFDWIDWGVVAYDEDVYSQELVAEGLFGASGFRGRLPVSVSPRFKYGHGLSSSSLFRLSYGLPEEVGMDSRVLRKIDTIAFNAIDSGATPGLVVLAAKDGKVIFHKAYGYHTYDEKNPVEVDHIFDLASVTKVMSTTLSVMRLYERDKVDIYRPLSEYLPELDSTNKAGLTLERVMRHRAGLKAWIPFYKQTVSTRNYPSPSFYRRQVDKTFRIPVTERLFMDHGFRDTIWQQIFRSDLKEDPEYVYSDLSFFLTARLVESVTEMPLDQYVQETFYKQLGMRTATYNPWAKFSLDRIPPTEIDKYFRRQRVQGYVHDMGAAMLGGVSGHAGLFGQAQDVAIFLQLMLNKGYYGGERFFKPETIELFTQRCTECTRRGIGFDMRQLDPDIPLNMSGKASPSTFGHLGFTGIAAWADPEHQLVYVFLSNRTYPSMRNNLLGSMDIRPRIQTVLYEAMSY